MGNCAQLTGDPSLLSDVLSRKNGSNQVFAKNGQRQKFKRDVMAGKNSKVTWGEVGIKKELKTQGDQRVNDSGNRQTSWGLNNQNLLNNCGHV